VETTTKFSPTNELSDTLLRVQKILENNSLNYFLN